MSSAVVNVTKHQKLSEVLRRELVNGNFKVGDALPSQNVLAERHAVSVTTVREAMGALAEQGLIERIQGKGTFLKNADVQPEATTLRHVGFVTAHLDLPYHAEFTHWMEMAMRSYQLALLLNSWEYFSEETSAALQRLLRETEGVILGPVNDSALLEFLLGGQKAPQNLVAFGSPEPLQAHSVATDMSVGTAEAVEHLVELGHRRIWFLTGETDSYQYGRRKGFEDAVRRFDLNPAECQVIHKNLLSYRQVSYRLTQEVLRNSSVLPTAMLVHNDNAAFGAFRALREEGLRVPEDISLIGCDNVSLSQYAPAPLTTIDLRIRDVAQMAGQMMAELLEEPSRNSLAYKEIRLSSRLVVRESTGRAPRGV